MRRPAAVVALTLAAVVFTAPPVASLVAAVGSSDLTLLPAGDTTLDTESGGLRVSVQPGGGVWQSAVVANRGRQRFTARLGGSAWLHPAVESVLLEPGQSETVRFTVAPPVDAPPGETVATLIAEVEGQPDVTRSIDVVVTVLAGVSPAPIRPDGAGTVTPERAAPARAASGESRDGADLVLLFAIVGGVGLLLAGLFVPPAVHAVKRRRELHRKMLRLHSGALSRVDARRIRRIVEASAAIGEIPRVPDKPTRADVKRARLRRRAAERHKLIRARQGRVRDEAHRFAAALWNDRVRATRERAEAERTERAARIERARREQAEMAARLAEEREAEDARRRERLRTSEEQRRADAAERARERSARTAARRSERRTAARRAADAARERELARQRDAEAERSDRVQLRSRVARRTAVAWGRAADAAARAQAARTAPVPGEDGSHRAPALDAPVAFLDPLTGKVMRPERAAGTGPALAGESHAGDRVDVVALDVEELNRQLASTPSHGTRAASAQSRSKP